MSKNKTEKRVVNIPKDQFDIIKEYCEEHSLDMVSWIVKNTTEKIQVKVPHERINAKQAKEIHECAKKVTMIDNWLDIAMEDIDKSIKWSATAPHISDETKKTGIYWGPTIKVKNVYGESVTLDLSDSQTEIIKKELVKNGFSISKNKDCYTKDTSYIITW
jgi:hypothetical protein